MSNYEELIFRKQPKYIYIWLTVILIIVISTVSIILFYRYNSFYQVNGLTVKQGSDNYVQILFENNKLDIIENADLVLNHRTVDFKYEISSYVYSDAGKVYREIKLFFLNDYQDGQIAILSFKTPKTTLLNRIKNKIKKGMM